MDIIGFIRKDKELVKKLMRFCDIEIYPTEQKPDDFDGRTAFTIDGMAFGCDASGGEYILLNDTTIGFNGSEGDCGRLAETTIELFELLLNISSWHDYTYIDLYKNDDLLNKYIIKAEKDHEEFYNENRPEEEKYNTTQKTLSEELSIKIYSDKIELLKRFHKTATRKPEYIYTFTEEDGTKTNSEGSLINRPLYDHVKKRMGL